MSNVSLRALYHAPVFTMDDVSAVDDEYRIAARRQMVQTQLKGRGIHDNTVLDAFARVPRHLFVPAAQRDSAYADHPLPIGHGQTISQPFIVAYMLERAQISPEDRVLEIGAGSAYQTALLAELAAEVYAMERVEELAQRAGRILADLGYSNVRVRAGDGTEGWPEFAPYDVIIGSAAAPQVPEPLVEQLASGGRLILPVGDFHQVLVLVQRKHRGRIEQTRLLPVRFVPMIAGS